MARSQIRSASRRQKEATTSAAGTKNEGGFLGGLSASGRRELTWIGIGVAAAGILELLLRPADIVFNWFEELNIFFLDAGELIVVPLVLSIGFGVFSYRRYQEVQGMITARERAQKMAQAAQQKADESEREAEELQRMSRALYETDLSALIKVDAKGKILQANEGMEIATGFAKDDLVGASVFSYFQHPERVKDILENAIEEGSAQDSHMEIRHMSGDSAPASFRVSTYDNVSGEKFAVIVSRSRDRVAN